MPDAWTLSDPRAATDGAFPQGAPAEDQLRYMLNHAVLAPSVLNTQPWRFVVEGPEVRLFADRTRQLRTVDPLGRGLAVSCGAALATLQLAARHYGYSAPCTLLPDAGDPDVLAWLRLGPPEPASADEDALFRAVARRRTEHRPFGADPVAPGVLAVLRREAEQQGARLVAFEAEDQKAALARLVAEAVHAQGIDPEQRDELAAWLRRDGDPRPDGVPDAEQDPGGRHTGGRVPAEAHAAAMERLVAEAPVVLVVTSRTDDARGWLTAGQALQRVLLRATLVGLSASFLNPAVEVEAVRERLAGLVGGECPQVVLRMGLPVPRGGTPRRRPGDVSS